MYQKNVEIYSTVSIECCYQNVGIATSVALTMFQGNELSEAMGVPLYYGGLEALILGFYCVGAWKAGWTKASPTDSFWKTLFTSYEVLLTEQKVLQEIEVSLSPSSSMESLDNNGSTLNAYFHMEDKKRLNKKPSGLDVQAIVESKTLSEARRKSTIEKKPSEPPSQYTPAVV